MSEGINRVTLLGNLGADPELRITPGGQALLRLRVATTEQFLDRNAERQERTEWHRVTFWDKRAEGLAKVLHKGDRVYIEGSLQTTSYEKNGEKRYSTDIRGHEFRFGGSKASGAARPPAAASSPPHFGDDPTPSHVAPAPEGDRDDDIPF